MEGASRGQERGDNLWRGLAALLFIVLALGCAVMIASMVDISQTPTCHDVQFNGAAPNDGECFSGSSLQKTLSLVLGFPSGALAGIAGVLAVLFAVTGRHARLTLTLAGVAIALGVLSIVVGSV